MREFDEFYSKSLYPFQDGILNIVKELKLPFYLTGGTALSRGYFEHRFSDDLDLFVNNDDNFNQYTETFYKILLEKHQSGLFKFDQQRTRRSENFAQFFLSNNESELKIYLVNDAAVHYGDLIENNKLGKLDSLRNILSNKLAALFRYEAKDIADIWIIRRNYRCNFKEIISEAKGKEAGVDPVAVYEILSSFLLKYLGIN